MLRNEVGVVLFVVGCHEGKNGVMDYWAYCYSIFLGLYFSIPEYYCDNAKDKSGYLCDDEEVEANLGQNCWVCFCDWAYNHNYAVADGEQRPADGKNARNSTDSALEMKNTYKNRANNKDDEEGQRNETYGSCGSSSRCWWNSSISTGWGCYCITGFVDWVVDLIGRTWGYAERTSY